MKAHTSLHNAATISLLKQLISIPSFSKEENKTAFCIESFLNAHDMVPKRKENNVWAVNFYFDPAKPVILLNSHHDTVKPNPGYTLNPFQPIEADGKLFGLGSNDAGASLVCLLAVFLHYYRQQNLAYNIIYAATAEEEISGQKGIARILDELGKIDFAIVGEPTQMQIAIAEKGLLVLDCVSSGIAAHAANEGGSNAIYNAFQDIEWFKSFRFPKISSMLGEVKMNITMIESGTQHNVIPDTCKFVVDVRTTDAYTHEEIIAVIKENVQCKVSPRSLRMKPSSISIQHPFIQAGIKMGRKIFGSATTSDQALLPFNSLKMGPGDSLRSHSADEFIFLHELEEGIAIYIQILDQFIHQK